MSFKVKSNSEHFIVLVSKKQNKQNRKQDERKSHLQITCVLISHVSLLNVLR